MSSPSHREQAIRELVGLPDRLNYRSQAGTSRVRIDDLRRILDLPDPAYRELLTADRWIAGGAVMRWISSALGRSEAEGGDYDFFAPSIEGVNRTLDELLAAGFTFRCFRSYQIMCPLCGGPGEIVWRGEPHGPPWPVGPIRCPACGECDPEDVDRFPVDRLCRLTPERIRDNRVLAVELLSPQNDLAHISTIAIKPNPGEVIAYFDFSIVGFALDNEYLYFRPYAWTDLLLRRLRRNARIPEYYRVRKFLAMGFRPYPATVVWLARSLARWISRPLVKRLRRGATVPPP
ncbi:MAG: hypothetical protein GY856_46375 [bacterium]|nr:hypothetical protein [bacterium]